MIANEMSGRGEYQGTESPDYGWLIRQNNVKELETKEGCVS